MDPAASPSSQLPPPPPPPPKPPKPHLPPQTKPLIATLLTLTKKIHAESNDELVKACASEANRHAVSLKKRLQLDANASVVREKVLRQCLRDELVDRDAHAARITERQRVATERLQATGKNTLTTISQKASDGLRLVEKSLVAADPFQLRFSESCQTIHERFDETQTRK